MKLKAKSIHTRMFLLSLSLLILAFSDKIRHQGPLQLKRKLGARLDFPASVSNSLLNIVDRTAPTCLK